MIPNLIAGLLGSGVAAVGDYESISTVTVGGTAQASITFSSIPSTYTHLQIRTIAKYTGSVDYSTFSLTFNADTTASYSWHELYGSGGGVGSGASANASSIRSGLIPWSTYANGFGAAIIDILDYSNTSKNTTIKSLDGVEINNPGVIALHSGTWYKTNAVTSITFTPSSNNFPQYTQFALYGVN